MLIENDTEWRQPVQILPLTQAFPDLGSLSNETKLLMNEQFKEYSEKRVVLTENRERLFGVFSAKAPIVRHTDFVEGITQAYQKLFSEEPIINVSSFDGGAKMVVRCDLPEKYSLDFGNSDVSNLMLVGQNSYDHSYGFKLNIGMLRLICTNGAVAGKVIESINAKEFSNRMVANTLPARIARLIDKSTDLVDVWRKWLDIKLPRLPVNLILDKYFPKRFYEPLLQECVFPVSKYELYNLLTRRSTHDITDDKHRWSADNTIARLFYSSMLDEAASEFEKELQTTPIFANEHVTEQVTITDDITH